MRLTDPAESHHFGTKVGTYLALTEFRSGAGPVHRIDTYPLLLFGSLLCRPCGLGASRPSVPKDSRSSAQGTHNAQIMLGRLRDREVLRRNAIIAKLYRRLHALASVQSCAGRWYAEGDRYPERAPEERENLDSAGVIPQ